MEVQSPACVMSRSWADNFGVEMEPMEEEVEEMEDEGE